MSERIEEIRERLGNATPGPWKPDAGVRGDCVVWGPDGQFLLNQQAEPHWLPDANGRQRMVAFDVDRRDCEFIANAREDIPFLLAEVERLEAELAKTKRGAVTLGKIIDRQGLAVLDITGLRHMVDEDMDGDWGAIWDILAEQAAKGRRLQEAQAEAWDEGYRARMFGSLNTCNPYRTA